MGRRVETATMGRRYAAVLGLLAFAAVLLRSIFAGSSAEAALEQAIVSLFGFAIVGAIGGWLAGWIVEDAIRTRLRAELAQPQEAAGNRGARKQ